jgi:hypothetical protein
MYNILFIGRASRVCDALFSKSRSDNYFFFQSIIKISCVHWLKLLFGILELSAKSGKLGSKRILGFLKHRRTIKIQDGTGPKETSRGANANLFLNPG